MKMYEDCSLSYKYGGDLFLRQTYLKYFHIIFKAFVNRS